MTQDDCTKLAEIRRRYDSGEALASLAQAMGMSGPAFLVWRRAEGWPLRPSPIGRRRAPLPQAAEQAAEPEPAPARTAQDAAVASRRRIDLPALARRMARAIEGEMTAIEPRIGQGKAEDAERNAKLLASLVKMLGDLQRIEAMHVERQAGERAARRASQDEGGREGEGDGEPAARDLDTLRRELQDALARLGGEGP